VLNPRAACDCRIARSFKSLTLSEDFTSSYDRSDEQQGLAVRGARNIGRAHKPQAENDRRCASSKTVPKRIGSTK
jgi:hypothetical protein